MKDQPYRAENYIYPSMPMLYITKSSWGFFINMILPRPLRAQKYISADLQGSSQSNLGKSLLVKGTFPNLIPWSKYFKTVVEGLEDLKSANFMGKTY